MKKRAIEVYLGYTSNDSDYGTWTTEYVDIPEDTPEDKIEEVARDSARAEGHKFIFCGIYCIPELDDQPYEQEQTKEEKISRIKEIIKEWGETSTAELEAQTSPVISCHGEQSVLVEHFFEDYVSVFTYVGSVEVAEDEWKYEQLEEDTIDQILDLLEDYDVDNFKTQQRCED